MKKCKLLSFRHYVLHHYPLQKKTINTCKKIYNYEYLRHEKLKCGDSIDILAYANISIVGFATIFSLGLCIISLISYRRSKNKKIFFVSLVLLLFFIKNLFLSITLFTAPIQNNTMLLALGLFDLFILLFLYIAVLTK